MGATTDRARPTTPDRFDVLVRPRPALLRSTALSIVLSAVPLAVALLWVSFPLRLWAVVASLVVLVAVLVAVVFVRFRTAFVGIDAERVHVRGVLSPTITVDRATVGRVVLASTYGWTVDRTAQDLIALSASGEHLFRMRGVLWDDAGIARVVRALDVQVTELPTPMRVSELHRMFPASRTWYDRVLLV